MSKSNVIDLVLSLSNAQADPNAIDAYYGEAIRELGLRPILVDASLIDVSGPNPYTMPEWVLEPLQWYYDDTVLFVADLTEIAQWDQDWDTRRSQPVAVHRDDVGLRQFELIPRPDAPSKPYIFLGGSPMGTDFPAYNLCVFATEQVTDVPLWLEYTLACMILSREFARTSDHQDEQTAVAYAQLGALLVEVLG